MNCNTILKKIHSKLTYSIVFILTTLNFKRNLKHVKFYCAKPTLFLRVILNSCVQVYYYKIYIIILYCSVDTEKRN